MTTTTPEWQDSHLDIDVDPPVDVDAMLLPDLYVGLEIDLLAPGDGLVTDRHHASADRYEADDPMNQIEGQISPFTLSGWLRHGCEQVVQTAGATACHPGEPNADYMRANVYERDLDAGYHEKGTCLDDHDDGCVIYDLFGGFGSQPGKLLRRPVSFSPIRRHVDVLDGEAEAHFRQISNQVRSRNEDDGGQPLRQADRDVLGNVEGTWKLTLRELKPEFVGLLIEAVAFLDAHSDEFEFQLGGARNFGAGVADVWVVNPLYTEAEVRRVFNRAQGTTSAMEDKDERWRTELRDEFVRALQARTAMRDGDLPMPSLDGEEA
ncbi:Uncharacterized protein HSRCO_1534 [Halanaeroarchaeum sp. HSR-CO]|uniref:hypothetical protein n=1 Tax=Halanaeroarchaeum sp. HSR-CO TaxID=2866382 RepID=UPI00217CD3C1|nr:hypothetical protein [Halanaeroarchaeum sp. HSR-CO]UWG47815.1 Uncharacterized protein HSRCO_1534 [Halanaeroarchaeum sp. HSR-CO]